MMLNLRLARVLCFFLVSLPLGCRSISDPNQEQASPTDSRQWNIIIAYPGSTIEIHGDGDGDLLKVDASGDVAGEATSDGDASITPTVDVEADIDPSVVPGG